MKRLESQRGFTLVETMMAVGLVIVVAVLGSKIVMSSTVSIQQVRMQKKAIVLADMIFAQYSAYALQNYQNLSQYDRTNVKAQDFFGQSTSFGYDRILITTLASYSDNRSSSTITVTLHYPESSGIKTVQYTKVFTQPSQTGSGGVVQVWVCSSGTTPDTCVGIPGFKVAAPAAIAGTSTSNLTDANGQVLLNSVAIGNAVAVTINSMPADFNGSITTPGYFTTDSSGNYTFVESSGVVVRQGAVTSIVISDYRHFGQISGDDVLNPNTPINDVRVSLIGAYVVYQSTIQVCGTGALGIGCTVLTSTNPVNNQQGHFLFNNVLPFTPAGGLALSVPGRAGSDAIDPNYVPGYVGDYSIPLAAWSTGNVPSITATVVLQKLGSVILQLRDLFDNTIIMPNFPVDVELPPTPWAPERWIFNQVFSDASGNIALNNIYASNTGLVGAYGNTPPNGGTGYGSNGYFVSFHWTCNQTCIGVTTPLPVPVEAGYALTGKLIDSNPSSLGNVMQGARVWADDQSGATTAAVDNQGNFVIHGYFALYAGFQPTQTSFPAPIHFENLTLQFPTTLVGQTVDQATGAPALNTKMSINLDSYKSTNLVYIATSDANTGNFTISTNLPYRANISMNAKCDNATDTCVVSPGAVWPCPASGMPVPMDSSINTVIFNKGAGSGYILQNVFNVTAHPSVPTPFFTIPHYLNGQKVQGLVSNAGGSLVAGISVYDNDGLLVGVTGDGTGGTTLGGYSGYASVDNRSSATQLGTFTLGIPAQQGFGSGGTNAVPEPASVDPSIPVLENMTLHGTGGTSGGGA